MVIVLSIQPHIHTQACTQNIQEGENMLGVGLIEIV